MHVVGIGKTPYPIDEDEVASLRVVVDSGLQVESWPYLHVGQRIQIVSGPLTGSSGILQSVKSRDRLVVSISLLQRSVSVEIPEHCAWPATA
jgi:transcription antitermination factor NusG